MPLQVDHLGESFNPRPQYITKAEREATKAIVTYRSLAPTTIQGAIQLIEGDVKAMRTCTKDAHIDQQEGDWILYFGLPKLETLSIL